jgi:acyl carrier protein
MAELTKDEIRAKIKKIVVENLGVSEDQVTDDA